MICTFAFLFPKNIHKKILYNLFAYTGKAFEKANNKNFRYKPFSIYPNNFRKNKYRKILLYPLYVYQRFPQKVNTEDFQTTKFPWQCVMYQGVLKNQNYSKHQKFRGTIPLVCTKTFPKINTKKS